MTAGALALSVAACGGDDDGGGTPDAAANPDADTTPDATVIELLRSGTVAVAQNTVTDPEAAGVGGISGATVSVGFSDLTTVTVLPLDGLDNAVGGCAVTVYDIEGGDELATPTDEGTVVISGTNNEAFGCGFSALDGEYHCQSATAAHANGSANGVIAAVTGGGQTITFSFTSSPFAANALRGGYVLLSGFTETAGGAASVFNGIPLPVVGNATNAIVVANSVAYAGAGTGGAGATYSNFLGAGPIPSGFAFLDEGDSITVTKAASDNVDAFDIDSDPNGIGLTLDDASALPHAFPAVADGDLTYSCSGAGGECGVSNAGTLNVMTISGEASDGSLAGLSPFSMPDYDSGTQYVTFQCSALSVGAVEIPEAAVAAILGINPTRVRVSVGVFAGQFVTDDVPDDDTRLLVGSLLTGFTDIE